MIISDGCRDYVVEARRDSGAGLLTDRQGRPLRFASLAEARRAARHASDITLAMRVAADEACAGKSGAHSGFSLLPVAAGAV